MSILIFNEIKSISHNISNLLRSMAAGIDIAKDRHKKSVNQAGGLEKADFCVSPSSISESPTSLPTV
jgi:hypothetical protein